LSGNLDPDTVTFDIVRRLVGRIALVSERQLRDTIGGLVREERLITEGAGAATAAAILSGAVETRSRRTAVILSGANIDLDKLKTLI
jgi:threonine dehydratase